MMVCLSLLNFRGRSVLWLQTVTGLIGMSIIVTLPALLLYLLLAVSSGNEAVLQPINLLLLLLVCWNIVIMLHVLRHALECNMLFCIILILVYTSMVADLTSIIIPLETAV